MSESDVQPPSGFRRQAPRAGVVLEVRYRNAGHLLVSYCTNLSRGGLFVPSTEPLPPGTKLTLSLDIPGQPEPARLQAEVRWVRQFDADQGPAGMGLAFDDVDDLLGRRIDGIVTDYKPMKVVLVGDRPHTIVSLGSKVRSLVSCETTHRGANPAIAIELRDADLVIVDVDSAPEHGCDLLGALAMLESPPPRLALCDPSDSETYARVIRLARVLRTPIDSEELRTTVLETLTQVEASRH